MTLQLKKGVKLHTISSPKFKTIYICINFKEELSLENLSSRTLLSRIMDLTSQSYPNQKKMSQATSNLYGAQYLATGSRMGQAHVMSFRFVFPNHKFLPHGENMQKENRDFVKEVLFFPYIENGSFNERVFKREKKNLLDDYEALSDDKQEFALLRLNQLYYPDPAHQIPAIGRRKELDSVTSQSLYQLYKKMIEENELDIFVLGDVTEEETVLFFEDMPFTDRDESNFDILYSGASKEDLVISSDIQDVKQAKFNLAYQTPIHYLNDHYFTGLVFNGLFGAFPHSKLFMNVREKEGLAYHASSFLSSMTGKLTVQTGIDATTHQKTNQIIADQLTALQEGDFTDLAFQQTLKMLMNERYQSDDSPSAIISRAYRDVLVQAKIMSRKEWLERLKQVTVEDVVALAQAVKLKASYLLKGGQ